MRIMRSSRASAHLVDARLDVDDAGIVDKRVEPAKGAVDGFEHGDDIGFDADIALDRKSLAASRLDFGDQRLGGGLVRGIVDRDAVAGLRRQPADGGANAAAAAGDQQHLLRRAHSWQPFSRNTSHGSFENPLAPKADDICSDGPRSGKIRLCGASVPSAGSKRDIALVVGAVDDALPHRAGGKLVAGDVAGRAFVHQRAMRPRNA